jgi:hypothetical protein
MVFWSSVKVTVTGVTSFNLAGAFMLLLLCPRISCAKYFCTQRTGLGAAWPRPQMEASVITWYEVFQGRVVPHRGFHQCGGLGRAHAARGALPTALVREETHHVQRGVAGPVVLAEHDDSG